MSWSSSSVIRAPRLKCSVHSGSLSLEDLPNELLRIIFGYLVTNKVYRGGEEDTARVCLVSRNLLPVAQAVLYNTITLGFEWPSLEDRACIAEDQHWEWTGPDRDINGLNDRASSSLYRTLSHNTHVASLVRAIHVSERNISALVELLDICPNADRLALLWPISYALNGVPEALRRSRRKLRSLVVVDGDFSRPADSPQSRKGLAGFFETQTELEDLTFDAGQAMLQAFTEPPTWRLKMLRCSSLHFHHFAHYSTSTLRFLHLRMVSRPSPAALDLSAFTAVDSLTLTYHATGIPSDGHYVQAVAQLLPTIPSTVSTLRLEEERYEDPLPHHVIFKLLPLIPKSIKHIMLGSLHLSSSDLLSSDWT